MVRNHPEVVYAVPGTDAVGATVGNAFCRVTNSGQTQAKFAANYPLPFWGLEASATYQNNPGYPITASVVVPNAAIAPQLGRNLAAGSRANVTVEAIEPFTEFSDRIQQIDVRFGKRISIMRLRTRLQFDIYNVTNAGTVLAENSSYGSSWQKPLTILGGRLMKFGMTLDF